MQTYADTLAAQTVKQLNAIAKQMGLKGYSKLRKAALVEFIDDAVAALVPVILNTEAPADHAEILKLMAEVLPVEFSAAPAESVATALKEQTLTETTTDDEEPSLEDLKAAYRHMRKTVNGMRHSASRVRCVGRLRNLSDKLRSAGIKHPQYL